MALRVVVVEDRDRDWNAIEEAVSEHSKKMDGTPLVVVRGRTPEELPDLLKIDVDLIITDVFFEPSRRERLSDVISIVREWERKEAAERPSDRRLPIVAYTSRGKRALDICLKHRSELFDIWDKSIASGPYIVWRLSELSAELSRLRPDALLQRLIREMRRGPSWHDQVLAMARNYDSGVTETEQILKAGHSVRMVAQEHREFAAAREMWEVVEQWEMLGRAVDQRMRGHARHVINVFWLGYYLINNELLAPWWSNAWEGLKTERRGMTAVAQEDWREALSNIWFYAGLFHDIGYCVEKAETLKTRIGALNRTFGLSVAVADPNIEVAKEAIEGLLYEFDATMRAGLSAGLARSVEERKVDHGAFSAAKVVTAMGSGANGPYAREAARAIILHNLLPSSDPQLEISWANEPIGCLLLLCDQLQAWDRERFDDNYLRNALPDSAELEVMKVEKSSDGAVSIDMVIDYSTPRHLRVLRGADAATMDKLEDVLCEFPQKAISRIVGRWPFNLNIAFAMDGSRLVPRIVRP